MILVFGATGQIGGELISLLAADGSLPAPSHVTVRRCPRFADSNG